MHVRRLPRVDDFIFSRQQLLQIMTITNTSPKNHRLFPIVTIRFHSVLIFFNFLGGVRLSPLRTSATNWRIVPAPDDKWWVWSSRWNENWQRKPKYSEKTWPSVTLSTTNPTWPELSSNPGRSCGKPTTNHLTYGTAKTAFILSFSSINCKGKM
jgi:hypothetical protein